MGEKYQHTLQNINLIDILCSVLLLIFNLSFLKIIMATVTKIATRYGLPIVAIKFTRFWYIKPTFKGLQIYYHKEKVFEDEQGFFDHNSNSVNYGLNFSSKAKLLEFLKIHKTFFYN